MLHPFSRPPGRLDENALRLRSVYGKEAKIPMEHGFREKPQVEGTGKARRSSPLEASE